MPSEIRQKGQANTHLFGLPYAVNFSQGREVAGAWQRLFSLTSLSPRLNRFLDLPSCRARHQIQSIENTGSGVVDILLSGHNPRVRVRVLEDPERQFLKPRR